MAPRARQHPDRPPAHPSRGPSRCIAVRLKAPDAERLSEALDVRGLVVSDYLRSLILSDLDALEAGTAPGIGMTDIGTRKPHTVAP